MTDLALWGWEVFDSVVQVALVLAVIRLGTIIKNKRT